MGRLHVEGGGRNLEGLVVGDRLLRLGVDDRRHDRVVAPAGVREGDRVEALLHLLGARLPDRLGRALRVPAEQDVGVLVEAGQPAEGDGGLASLFGDGVELVFKRDLVVRVEGVDPAVGHDEGEVARFGAHLHHPRRREGQAVLRGEARRNRHGVVRVIIEHRLGRELDEIALRAHPAGDAPPLALRLRVGAGRQAQLHLSRDRRRVELVGKLDEDRSLDRDSSRPLPEAHPCGEVRIHHRFVVVVAVVIADFEPGVPEVFAVLHIQEEALFILLPDGEFHRRVGGNLLLKEAGRQAVLGGGNVAADADRPVERQVEIVDGERLHRVLRGVVPLAGRLGFHGRRRGVDGVFREAEGDEPAQRPDQQEDRQHGQRDQRGTAEFRLLPIARRGRGPRVHPGMLRRGAGLLLRGGVPVFILRAVVVKLRHGALSFPVVHTDADAFGKSVSTWVLSL